MNTKIITILSNYSYLIAAIYLINSKYYIYGICAFIIWYISHNYHNNTLDKFWDNLDMIIAAIFFTYIIINDYRKLSFYKVQIFLTITILFFISGFLCFDWKNCNDYNHDYNIIHSIWHILSALFSVYFITLTK